MGGVARALPRQKAFHRHGGRRRRARPEVSGDRRLARRAGRASRAAKGDGPLSGRTVHQPGQSRQAHPRHGHFRPCRRRRGREGERPEAGTENRRNPEKAVKNRGRAARCVAGDSGLDGRGCRLRRRRRGRTEACRQGRRVPRTDRAAASPLQQRSGCDAAARRRLGRAGARRLSKRGRPPRRGRGARFVGSGRDRGPRAKQAAIRGG